ncbi:Rna-binding protein [Thalictrum thalictroides]|uniref:Rna-binding protein n=1 Tax=Thalictrum thalictroides TaxID=46969 RepID=A0A7J6W650_THATH|nr:Rna-binding protein [Thalictrum thalictroides]
MTYTTYTMNVQLCTIKNALGNPETAEVVTDKRTGKSKGYGFVSFSNASDCAAALKEMNGKYVGTRPVKLRKSTWKERIDHEASERQKIHSRKKQGQFKKGVLHKLREIRSYAAAL